MTRVLWCLTVDHSKKPMGTPFKVILGDEDDVADLKKKVKEETDPVLNHIAAYLLIIWRRTDSENALNDNNAFSEDQIQSLFQQGKVGRLGEMELIGTLGIKKQEVLFVEVPTDTPDLETVSGSQPKKRLKFSETESVRTKVFDAWKIIRFNDPVPHPDALSGVVEEPLPDSAKIPITHKFYDSLVSDLLPDICSRNDIDIVFKIGAMEPNLVRLYTAVSLAPPHETGTEDSWHYFWDTNIRAPLEILMPNGKVIRNSNEHTSTRNLRPDFGFLLDTICPFRGEEKAPNNPGDPKAELVNKLNWVYDDAPYMLGYSCRGSAMTLVAIKQPASPGGKAILQDITTVDLSTRKGRMTNIRHLINLSGIIQKLTGLVRIPVNDFRVYERINCTVEITSSLIVKTYTCNDAGAKVGHLRGIYALLAKEHIPHTDSLVWSEKNVVHLSPRGLSEQPLFGEELLECIICILELLVATHKVPIYHRDIRWNNVIREIHDPSKWFLIDWEDAALPPTRAEPSFARSTHSPAIFQDGHGAEVDIWGIGYLIKTCTAVGVSAKLRELGDFVCVESHRLNASEVLELVYSIGTTKDDN